MKKALSKKSETKKDIPKVSFVEEPTSIEIREDRDDDEVLVPVEFQIFMSVLARQWGSSATISRSLVILKNMLIRAKGEDFANEYILKLAECYSSNRSPWMQEFMG